MKWLLQNKGQAISFFTLTLSVEATNTKSLSYGATHACTQEVELTHLIYNLSLILSKSGSCINISGTYKD